MSDTGASIAASPVAVPSRPAVASAAGLLAAPLPVDPRLIVGQAVTSNAADVRVRDANASIRARLRVVAESTYRHDLGWTVGDSTHRYGVAPCGIRISKICIPFGFRYMPSSMPSYNGVDRDRARDAEFGAAIDSARARNDRP
ncbi:MAG TPA: hypothetical protein VFA43_24220 [Gemmatimonadaceae bacterium]|nr:hypothetical protein [Gemmatimonadaceae bacterium]